jgi:hypothetical protein
MKITKVILQSAALIAIAMPAAFAQQAAPNDPMTINQRKENQQDRIANGVQDGQLTAGETKNLETDEAGINKEERTMRSEDDGKLTSADRTTLNNQQNKMSNQIYQDKHNANTAHYGNNEVGQRRENQQDRIANGIRNGSLSAGQTARLENHEQGINREVAGMRQANGGRLTGADRRAVNQQQNRVSRQIYNKKHS